MDDADMLLHVVRTARANKSLPADVARWAAGRIISELSQAERKEARDAILRKAATLVRGGPWAKMIAIRDELHLVRDEMTLYAHRPPPAGLTELMVAALTVDPATPLSRIQLLRILEDENPEG